MHTRIVTFTHVRNMDDGIAFIRDKVVPVLNSQPGYRGLSVSADRAGDLLCALTWWQTAEDRAASDEVLATNRREALSIMGGELDVENFEQTLAEARQPAQPGSALIVRRISMDPEQINANVAYFKTDVLPVMTAREGFRAVHHLIDRRTGRGVVGSMWDNVETMRAWEAFAQPLREQAGTNGVDFGELSHREIVLVDLP